MLLALHCDIEQARRRVAGNALVIRFAVVHIFYHRAIGANLAQIPPVADGEDRPARWMEDQP